MNAYRRGVRLTVTISPIASQAIDALLATGLWGPTRAAVAQEMIYRCLRDPRTIEFEGMGKRLRKATR
jgi:hypothetical protein